MQFIKQIGVFAVVSCLVAVQSHADAILVSPMVSPGTGNVVCSVTNAGKNKIPKVVVELSSAFSGNLATCLNLSTAINGSANHTCSISLSGTGPRVCTVTVEGAGSKSVRAHVSVENSSGATILSIPMVR